MSQCLSGSLTCVSDFTGLCLHRRDGSYHRVGGAGSQLLPQGTQLLLHHTHLLTQLTLILKGSSEIKHYSKTAGFGLHS